MSKILNSAKNAADATIQQKNQEKEQLQLEKEQQEEAINLKKHNEFIQKFPSWFAKVLVLCQKTEYDFSTANYQFYRNEIKFDYSDREYISLIYAALILLDIPFSISHYISHNIKLKKIHADDDEQENGSSWMCVFTLNPTHDEVIPSSEDRKHAKSVFKYMGLNPITVTKNVQQTIKLINKGKCKPDIYSHENPPFTCPVTGIHIFKKVTENYQIALAKCKARRTIEEKKGRNYEVTISEAKKYLLKNPDSSDLNYSSLDFLSDDPSSSGKWNIIGLVTLILVLCIVAANMPNMPS